MIYEYNKNGDLIDPTSEIESPKKTKYSYNSSGTTKERTQLFYNKSKVSTTFQYDSLNRLIEEVWYTNSILTARHRTTFDSKELNKEENSTSYSNDRKLEYKSITKYEYNEKNLIAKVINSSNNPDERYTLVFSYIYE